MRFNFYRSTCNAVLALVSLFAFGSSDGQGKTVQSADELLTAKNREVKLRTHLYGFRLLIV